MAVDHNNPQSRNEEILIATIDGNEYNKAPQSRMEELLLELKEVIEEGGGGTGDYESLSNQPQINGETLIGNKTGADLGLVDAEEGKVLSTNDYDDNEKAAVAAATSAISAMKDGTDIDSFGDVEVALLDKADTADLGTAAAKNSTNAVTSGSTDLVESGAVKDAIDAAVSAAYHHAGTKTVAQLTHDLLIAANEGNVYNITDSGTTTSDFIEGIGKTIDEGSNVGICKVGNTYMFDLLSGFVDTSNFVQKSVTAGLLKNDGTVNDEIEGDVATLKSGLTNLSDHVDGSATTYPYADVITINDAVPANLADCSVKVEPVQDLHGYDKPWVGGADDNIAKPRVTSTETISNIKFTPIEVDGNFIGVNISAGTVVGSNVNKGIVRFTAKETTSYRIIGAMLDGTITDDFRTLLYDLTADSSVKDFITNNNFTVNLTADHQYTISVYYKSGTTVTAQSLSIMVCKASTGITQFKPYSNICPISGHTEAVVDRVGKNRLLLTLADIKSANTSGTWANNVYTISNCTFTVNTDADGKVISITAANAATVSSYVLLNIPMPKDDNNYLFNGGVSSNYEIFIWDKTTSARAKKWDGITNSVTSTGSDFNEVKNVKDHNLLLVCRIGTNSPAGSGTFYPMVCPSFTTDPTYEPYAGQQYTLALGDTIYGGTVDFDSGVMVVDRKYSIVTSGNAWTRTSSDYSAWFYAASPESVNATTRDIISDKFSTGNKENGIWINFRQIHIHPDANVAPSGNTDEGLAEFKNWLSENHLQIVYPLATPFTIQLTPQQIQLLQGTNTLYASTGQISVTVNGVAGSIGAVQEQVNATDNALSQLAADIVEQLPDAPTTDGTYVLTVTVASGAATYSWEPAE